MRITEKVRFLLVCLLAFSGSAYSQDAHFSQQYANRLRLNPAFAGLASEASATSAYRNQWPSLTGAFTTSQLAADYRFTESKSAAGLIMTIDKAGNAGLTQFELGGIYSYHTRISENWAVSAGLQATYGSRRVDFSALTFGDQLSDEGLVNEFSAEPQVYDPVRYLSFAAGGILFNDQYWLSLSAHHLNEPDLGFAAESKLPFRMTLNTGYKFYAWTSISENKVYELSFTPTITYTRQGPFNKTDLGIYTLYTPVTVGIIYRGLPLLSSAEQAIAIITGVQLNQFKVAYSYDIGLSGISAMSGGAHEITLAFDKLDFTKIYRKRFSDKNYLQISCPAF
ncbi:MAG TPA: type IX secretion system membrane protein PorP/SprF [Adhaeribacter sp.]|nr:type IX secretion system membrane protein PorP/SprF [Adhaeribacter sp.]